MTTPIFLACDGDHVGDRIEVMLLRDDAVRAAAFSSSVNRAIREMVIDAENAPSCVVVFAGGDDLLIEASDSAQVASLAAILRGRFRELTGCTLSIGIGNSVRDAVLNLRLAKLTGRDRVVGEATS